MSETLNAEKSFSEDGPTVEGINLIGELLGDDTPCPSTFSSPKEKSSANGNKKLARSMTSNSSSSRKSDFATQYAHSMKDQMEFQKERLEMEKKWKLEDLKLRQQELEENKIAKIREQKGHMIERLASSGKTPEEIKQFLILFDEL